MGRDIHINGTVYSLRLLNRSMTGPVRNVSCHGLIVKHKISYAGVTEGKGFALRYKTQPDLRLGSKACNSNILQDYDSKG